MCRCPPPPASTLDSLPSFNIMNRVLGRKKWFPFVLFSYMVVDWSGALGRKMGALGRCLAGAWQGAWKSFGWHLNNVRERKSRFSFLQFAHGCGVLVGAWMENGRTLRAQWSKTGALGRCLAGADVFPSALAGRGSDACGLASRGRGRKCPVKVLRRLHKPKWHATKGSTGPRANCKTQETIRTSLKDILDTTSKRKTFACLQKLFPICEPSDQILI